MLYTFRPIVKSVGKVNGFDHVTDEMIADEEMFFSCTPVFVDDNAGPITKNVLQQITSNMTFLKMYYNSHGKGKNMVIDTRTNMLMPGQYPSIPGWHCDDVPRGEKYSQPDLNLVDDYTWHFMVLLSGQDNTSRTEFVYNDFTCQVDESDVWYSVDNEVESKKPSTMFVPEGHIVMFNQQAIHRASMAKTNGWRLFFRLSMTYRKPVDKIRKQVQVYVTRNGW